MADVLVVRDPDPDRRRRTADRAVARLVDQGLGATGSFERGDVLVVWGSAGGAPVSTSHGDGHDALLIGDRFSAGFDRAEDAEALAGRCVAGAVPPAADGFHLGVVVDDDGITAVVDTLGTMPLHHHHVGDCTFLVTAPGLLRSHERVDLRLGAVGLTSILLSGTPIGGLTCFHDVHRVRPRHAVRVPVGTGPVEVEQFAFDFVSEPLGVPFDELALEFDDRMRTAIARHLRPDQRVALLLSGGLDSRLMAGAARAAGRGFDAVTLGETTDLEHRFATRVASTLGVEHRTLPDPTDPEGFEADIRWGGLSAAPVLEKPALDSSYDRWFSGHGVDNTLGSAGTNRCYAPQTRSHGFDVVLAAWNTRGVEQGQLQRLLEGGAFGVEALTEARDAMRETFMAGGIDLLSRGWAFAQDHNDRHWVGKTFLHEMRRAWPTIPQYDLELLAVTRRVPIVALDGRRIQKTMLRLRYPELATVPLDRTNFDVDALDPQIVDQLRAVVLRRSIVLRQRLGLPVREVRRQTRVLDFDNEAWRQVRRRVEPARAHLHELFSAEVVDEILPRPDTPIAPDQHFPRSNGAKMMLAIAAMVDDGIGA